MLESILQELTLAVNELTTQIRIQNANSTERTENTSPSPAETPTASAVTIDDLRTAMRSLDKATAKAILADFDAKKLSDLIESDFELALERIEGTE
jgi:hypothetical protein